MKNLRRPKFEKKLPHFFTEAEMATLIRIPDTSTIMAFEPAICSIVQLRLRLGEWRICISAKSTIAKGWLKVPERGIKHASFHR